MRRSTTALWLCLGALIVAVGVVMVAMPRTAELAGIDDDSVSTTLPADEPPPTTSSSSTTTTSRSLEDLDPEELAAFSEYVNPSTTTTTAPPPPTTVYRPPTTPAPAPLPEVQSEPAYEPEPLPEVEPDYSGSGCVIPAYICQRESGMSYTALNPSSGAGGMYQFMPSTWRGIANAIAPEWANTAPHQAPPWVQDMFATYLWDGGRGCSHWSAC